MATSALAIKYRPKTFEEVVEQSVPTQLLRSLCESKDLTTRNFLLIGSAGCGLSLKYFSKYVCVSVSAR